MVLFLSHSGKLAISQIRARNVPAHSFNVNPFPAMQRTVGCSDHGFHTRDPVFQAGVYLRRACQDRMRQSFELQAEGVAVLRIRTAKLLCGRAVDSRVLALKPNVRIGTSNVAA